MTHNPETVERVAKAINGPHDPTHIGEAKLRELQDYRWDHQTDKMSRQHRLTQARAALSALPPQEVRPSPKVRKLVWDGTFDHRKTAHCIIGTYEVCSDRNGVHCLFFEPDESVPHEVSPSCQNMDLAKATAQSDYEARILGALE